MQVFPKVEFFGQKIEAWNSVFQKLTLCLVMLHVVPFEASIESKEKPLSKLSLCV